MARAQKKDTPPRKWPKAGKTPIAFMFQPTEYRTVTPDRLKEWEAGLRKFVGFSPALVAAISSAGFMETMCGCPEYDD
jgi:hypothetical protein